MTTALHAAALAFWKATGGDRLPTLPDNPADAAAAVLRARPKKTWACTFGAVDLPDPWPALAVGEGDLTWPEVVWALGCADLVPCATAHDGSVLVIDRAPDPRGEHRAFFVTRTGEVLGPWFSSTTSLMEWAAALAESPDDDDDSELDREPPPRDLWNRSTLSGVGALPAWRQFSPARYYRAARTRQWPDNTFDPGTVRDGDPTRTNLLRVVGRFTKTRSFAMPAALTDALTDAQRTYLTRLQEIARALESSAAPPYLTTLAAGADASRATAARAWITQFEGARPSSPSSGAKRSPAKAARPEGDDLKVVYNAVQTCLMALSTDGAIELSPENRAELVEEILAAMMKAGSADRAVLAAVGVVTESPLVEEVFADDLLLRKAFRKALGRG